MADTKCYKIHADLSSVKDLNVFVENIAKIGGMIFDQDGNIAVWLDDEYNKSDLIKVLKKNKVSEYFCEPITYDVVNTEKGNFFSIWFVDNYKAFLSREIERQNQSALREMYDNISKAQVELDKIKKQELTKTSMTNNNLKEARH